MDCFEGVFESVSSCICSQRHARKVETPVYSLSARRGSQLQQYLPSARAAEAVYRSIFFQRRARKLYTRVFTFSGTRGSRILRYLPSAAAAGSRYRGFQTKLGNRSEKISNAMPQTNTTTVFRLTPFHSFKTIPQILLKKTFSDIRMLHEKASITGESVK